MRTLLTLSVVLLLVAVGGACAKGLQKVTAPIEPLSASIADCRVSCATDARVERSTAIAWLIIDLSGCQGDSLCSVQAQESFQDSMVYINLQHQTCVEACDHDQGQGGGGQ